jgi:AcrR family transcriptional regulator
LVHQSQGVSSRQQDASRRRERANRILDAAAALILRWGYNKTTLDDVSREAGVSKSTIYLHWKTREELFAALVERERIEMVEDFIQRLAEDPAGATLRGMLKYTALALMKRPLLKALFLRDMEVIGKLAHSGLSSAAYTERLEGFKAYLEFLREYGLIRTDLSLEAQLYMYSAITTGFLLIGSWMPDEFTLSDDELVELMAETVHCTLESDCPASSNELQSISHTFMEYLDHTLATMRERFGQALEG